MGKMKEITQNQSNYSTVFLTSYPHWVVDNVDKCMKFTYENIGKRS